MKHLSHYLVLEHHHCDDLFAQVESAVDQKDWGHATEWFEQFHRDMLLHFSKEEECLFPALEAALGTSQGPTAVMRSEHQQMRGLLDQLASSLAGKNTTDYLGRSETLLFFMQQHNLKEENILYRMADLHLAHQADQLLQQMFHPVAAA